MAGRPKGQPKTGGRQKGSVNKISVDAHALAEKLGINPLEVLLYFAAADYKSLGYENECYFMEKSDGAIKMGYVISPETRAKCAQDACKYLYSQKRAVEHSMDAEQPLRMIIEDYTSKKTNDI